MIHAYDVADSKLHIANFIQIGKGKHAWKLAKAYCGFDIETTNMIDRENNIKEAYMYHWQFSFNDIVIYGRKWREFKYLINKIEKVNGFRDNVKMIVWVANLSFEFQFIRKWLHVTRLFAKEERQPLLVEHNGWLQFREALSISGGNLEQLAKDYCTTQKLVGDLDYSIKRNSCTVLTDKEKAYCENDVIILKEFSEYIFDKYIIPNRKIPMTKTGILRDEVKANIKDLKKVNDIMMQLFPNEKEYRICMNWLFRGGYVHSNVLHTGIMLYDVYSYDITSSYPAVMLHNNNYPVSRFAKKEINCESELQELCGKYAVYFIAEFENIKNKTLHSIESRNKIIDYSKDAVFDNGRLVKASYIKVMLTDIDYNIYNMFYQWDEINITFCKYAKRGKLPNYLLQTLSEEYTKKATLKKQGKQDTTEYMISKQKVNSFFGMCVTRFHFDNIAYENDEWTTINDFDYLKEVSKQFLSSFWGIWVTANARYNLLSNLHKIGEDSVYCDTDSIKFLNADKHMQVFDDWNKNMIAINKAMCIERNLDFDIFSDLGCFDLDGHYEQMKTLGSKRYLVKENGKYKATIAGLPKKVIPSLANKGINPFDLFENEMEIDIADSCKLTTCYNDNETSCVVDGELMAEKSSVALYEIPFKLNITNEYKNYINYIMKYYDRKKV